MHVWRNSLALVSQLVKLTRLTSVVALLLCTTSLVLGASEVCAAAEAENAPQKGASSEKNVRVLLFDQATTTDPWDANDTVSQSIARSFYEGLFGLDRHMRVRPVLATGHEVSDDGLAYTVPLRKNVRFHDKTPFNAQAVKINFDRVCNPENRLQRYALYSNIASTEVVDAYTVRFRLKKPFSAFLNQLAHPSAGIISPTALKKYGADIVYRPVGTGPFVFEEWRQSDFLRGRANRDYWQPGMPGVDALTWIYVPDSDSRVAMMRLGQGHFTSNIRPDQADRLRGVEGVKVLSDPSIVCTYVSLNTLQKPFDDVRVRQALNYAVDKQALLSTIYRGYGEVTPGVVPAGLEFAHTLGEWPYDLQKARALLAEAGYPDGFETELWSGFGDSRSRRVLQFLERQFQNVGVTVIPQVLESTERVAMVDSAPNPAKAPVRMYYVFWSSSTGEADWALRPLFHGDYMPPTPYNTAYYNNPRVNTLLEQALATRSTEEKQRIYAEAQQRIWNDAPWVFLITPHSLYAVSDRLSGLYMLPDGGVMFEKLQLRD